MVARALALTSTALVLSRDSHLASPCRRLTSRWRPFVPAAPSRRAPVDLRAWRERDEPLEDRVIFDGEEDWEEGGTNVTSGLGALPGAALRLLGTLADRITATAVQLAPQDVSPGVVKTAVNAGLIIVLLGFARSILSFLVTIGTLVLGAYLAIKVFRINIPTLNQDRGDGRHRGGPQGGSRRTQSGAARYRSEFQGLLGARDAVKNDDLMDVVFAPKQKKGKDGRRPGRPVRR
ncbi:hypothetical protein ACKKBG_A33830 [Auxenochlorella protothecoides x Auxenochlorella symbiontica]|uniref:Uncharacterized protein n=1 Tax=Auxenochlorella protothecoides TaxID=3075 RepID=A0A1D2A192_AUXPR